MHGARVLLRMHVVWQLSPVQPAPAKLAIHACTRLYAITLMLCMYYVYACQVGRISSTYTYSQLERQRHTTTVNVTSSIVPPPQDRDAWQEKPDHQQFVTSLITYVRMYVFRKFNDAYIQFCLIRTGVYQIIEIWHFAPSLQADCDDYYQLNGIMHGSRWS